MIDRYAIVWLRPAFVAGARVLARFGTKADHVTLAGFAIGVVGAVAIASRHYPLGLGVLAISRICDGLDGALARLSVPTDRGGFLDISLDFLFYASVPLAFAVADPGANALPAAVLLTTFIGATTTFLAFAAVAAQRGLKSEAYPAKGFYYLGGLAEATETLTVFALMCLWPAHFPTLAYFFAALCAVTTLTRLLAGWQAFSR
ncbi:MAG TPA: CDP-alcohol phosphatidyltransferase family protein [Caldimonas sp.]